jgi:hypothetical protein
MDLFVAFFRTVYGDAFDRDGAAGVIRELQENPAVIDTALQNLVYAFQERFGVVAARLISRTRLLRPMRRARALWLTDPVNVFADLTSALEYWRDVDSLLGQSSAAQHDTTGEHRPAGAADIVVLAAPLMLTEAAFLQSTLLHDVPSALGRATADIGAALSMLVALGFAHSSTVSDEHSRRAGVCAWPLAHSIRPLARWILAFSLAGVVAFLLRTAWIWTG